MKRRETQQNALLRVAFYIKTKGDYYITFLLCNLLTGAESAVRLSVASRIRPNFITSNSRYFRF
ncbi:hypothetical protein B1J94_09875 [Leptospira kirschneri serovar Grippotyphosa]|nr:hypothetical protein B1J94_09875 [Leptospira kirschneri serovar Grippotyphosa]